MLCFTYYGENNCRTIIVLLLPIVNHQWLPIVSIRLNNDDFTVYLSICAYQIRNIIIPLTQTQRAHAHHDHDD